MAKDFAEFAFSNSIKKQIKDKIILKKELALGITLQTIVGFGEETMAKFYKTARQVFENKQYTDAADAFLFLATLNPHQHDYWLGLGMATQMNHDYEGAIDAYELAALCELDSPVPYFYLAKCLFAIHDRKSALQALELAIEIAEDKPAYQELKEQAQNAQNILLKD